MLTGKYISGLVLTGLAQVTTAPDANASWSWNNASWILSEWTRATLNYTDITTKPNRDGAE